MNAELRQECIYRSHLNAGSPAGVAQIGSFDVILPIWNKQWQRRKVFENAVPRLRTGESLKQFLKHDTSREDALTALKRVGQHIDFRPRYSIIPAECE